MGIEIRIDCATGEKVVEEAQTRSVDLDILASEIREKRNHLLAESDWTQLNDCPLSVEMIGNWRIYRQALRDIPEQEGFPLNVIYPIINF